MHALLFEGPDHSFDHPVLLRVVWRDELLAQTVALDQCGESTACEHQTVVAAKQKRAGHATQRSEASDQRLLEGRFGRLAAPAPG